MHGKVSCRTECASSWSEFICTCGIRFLSAEAENLAREIAGEGASREILKLAHRIAEAQIDIVRVRQARHDLLSRDLNDPEFRPNKYFKDAKRNDKNALLATCGASARMCHFHLW